MTPRDAAEIGLLVLIAVVVVIANSLRVPGTSTARYGPLRGCRVGCISVGMIVGLLGSLVAVTGAILGVSSGTWALFWFGVIVAAVGWAVWLSQYDRFPWYGD
jgi:hypothetical protein